MLKFSKDRQRWLELLFQAKRKYGLVVSDYIVTSNHIHLLVAADGDRDTIPKSMQMVAGQTGQEYNRRKNRRGAFWEDRYHATAIESGTHLVQCLVYIDMNMVRTGVVAHPSAWQWSGYNEIQHPKQRYAIIDYDRLYGLFGLASAVQFIETHKKWLEEALTTDRQKREAKWSQAVAVGSESYIEKIKKQLGMKVVHRKASPAGDGFELREADVPYNADFAPESGMLRSNNSLFWKLFKILKS